MQNKILVLTALLICTLAILFCSLGMDIVTHQETGVQIEKRGYIENITHSNYFLYPITVVCFEDGDCLDFSGHRYDIPLHRNMTIVYYSVGYTYDIISIDGKDTG